MNRINEIQNNDSSLKQLAAMRSLYTQSKRILSIRFAITLSIAILFPILSNKYPAYQFYFALIALVYFVTNFLFWEKAESNKKQLAAKIQEQFDTQVLNISWNEIVAEDKPDPEDINQNYKKIFETQLNSIRNWYPDKISQLPEDIAKTICQRSNIWWDSKLRRAYAYCLTATFTILLAVLVWFIKDKIIADGFIFFAPFAPILRLLFEQAFSQHKSADRLDKLKNQLNKILDEVVTNPVINISPIVTRSIQDEIFRHRSTNTPIPDVVYKLLKNSYEGSMTFSADGYINKYLSTAEHTSK